MAASAKTYRLLAVLYALLVVTLSSWPSIRLPGLGTGHLDKLLHFGQYAFFAYLVARAWGGSGAEDSGSGRSGVRRYAILWVVLLLFAAVDEYHQGWIPGRDPDWRDWIADTLGIASGFWLGGWKRRATWRARGAGRGTAPNAGSSTRRAPTR